MLTSTESWELQGLSIDLVRQFSRHRTLQTLLVYRDQHENKQHAFAEWVSKTVARAAEPG